jgi:hypothetical protein
VAIGEHFGSTVARARDDTGEGYSGDRSRGGRVGREGKGAERRRGQDSAHGGGSAPAAELKQGEQRGCRGRRRGTENQGLIWKSWKVQGFFRKLKFLTDPKIK